MIYSSFSAPAFSASQKNLLLQHFWVNIEVDPPPSYQLIKYGCL